MLVGDIDTGQHARSHCMQLAHTPCFAVMVVLCAVMQQDTLHLST
jgi:hypothetical protein